MKTPSINSFTDQQLDHIADALVEEGYVVCQQLLPSSLLDDLQQRAQSIQADQWQAAGVGRADQFQVDRQIRSDKIHWLENSDASETAFLDLMDNLKQGINQRLFMGLFDYESHFSIYDKGQFYQKHIDALKGRSNRILSTVLYLNDNWQAQDAGELILFSADGETILETVQPCKGTMIIFLSEKFPHQVQAAQRLRFSIAGWYRVNNNLNGRLDPAS